MNICHSVRIILFSLFLASFLGCEKSSFDGNFSKKIEGVSSEEIYDDEANTFEINEPVDTSEEIDTPQYISDSGPTVTRISSIECQRVGTAQGLDDCNKYKYPNYYNVNTSPKVVTVILSRPDTPRAIVAGVHGNNNDFIVDDFEQLGPKTLRFTLAASRDTIQTKTLYIGITSGIPLSRANPNSVYPTMTFKMKCVGELPDENGIKRLYGTNKWYELYWARFFNKTVTAKTPITITENYVPQLGDVLVWEDGHTGTITKFHSSILRNRPRSQGGAEYRQNRFYLSEMNSRCKGEKTVKFIWHKSYDQTTLKSAQASRGFARFYYRY